MAILDSRDLVDTAAAVSALVDVLYAQPTAPPSLYVDLEGINLSRYGSISILQIYVHPLDQAYLVDIHTLGRTAFCTPGPAYTASAGRTLRDLLEDGAVPKVFFDVRNDSDALYSHFGVRLEGVVDLQLMELATRPAPTAVRPRNVFVSGLAKCIGVLAPAERAAWAAAKDRGRRLFAPELGGTYSVFNQRPLSEEVWLYSVQDVRFLPRLWALYDARLRRKPGWEHRSQTPSFNGKGRHMALPPDGWF
ncbi:ribonuclease H-like domain-containing protein [Thermothelomyces heterothallicus CBS 202.75]|uniref:ribonuclease H-like domain-containing protein n=1 Tax=Thermothelomyces heterothallicus CBS 202.75 TaxID=1149848 RepID=UPI003744161D